MERVFTITTGKLVEVEVTIEAANEQEALEKLGGGIFCDHDEVGEPFQHGDIVIEERTDCTECTEPATHYLFEAGETTGHLCDDCAKEFKEYDEAAHNTSVVICEFE